MLSKYVPHRKENEDIILLLRRHPFIILSKIFFWGLVAVMPIALYLILGDVLLPLFLNEYIYPIIILFTSIYYLYIWLFTFHSFVDYYLDVWIVTNRRIINVEQNGLLNRVISEQELDRIQDVTSETRGLASTLLNYGTVYVQTAGEHPRFTFEQVPNPTEVAQRVIKLVEHYKATAHPPALPSSNQKN